MKRFLAVGALVLSSGCAIQNSLPESVAAEGQDYLTPINVIVDDPFSASEVRNYLRQSGVFSAVEPGVGKASDYLVSVRLKRSEDPLALPLIFLGAATLFLLPIPTTFDTSAEFALQHDGKLLKEYQYRNVTKKYSWLLDGPNSAAEQNIKRLTDAFAYQVQKDGLVPAESAQ